MSVLTGCINALDMSEQQQENQQRRQKIIKILEGVPFKYSCPVPLAYEDNEADKKKLAEAFRDEFAKRVKVVNQQSNIVDLDDAVLFEKLFILTDSYPKLMVYPGYASGDVYGVGATLLLDPSMEILIIKDSTNTGRVDRTDFVKGFLKEFIKAERISDDKAPKTFANVPALNTSKDDEKSYLKALDTALWKVCLARKTLFCAVDLFFGTRYIAHRFTESSAVRKVIRSGWDVDNTMLNISSYMRIAYTLRTLGLESYDDIPVKKNIIVLWSRFTGKTGGAHLEYDTSFTGLEQLAKLAFDLGNDWVIIVGDKPKESLAFDAEKLKRRATKITAIQDKFRKEGKRIVDLTEFWKLKAWEGCFKFNLPRRIDQFKVFELLDRNNTVKHLGARSGNLESLALLGYTVRYFEDKNNDDALDKQRMAQWHIPVGYGRIQIAEVPTRSGKYMLSSNKKSDMYPKWHYKDRKKLKVDESYDKLSNNQKVYHKPPKVAELAKGFTVEDLKKFKDYLKLS